MNQTERFDIFSRSGIIDLQREPEDGTGSRHPSLGDAGSVTPPDSRTERGRCRDAAAFCFVYNAESPRRAVRTEIEARQETYPPAKKKALRRALSRSGGVVLFKGLGVLPNKYLQGKALYAQRHCLQMSGVVYTLTLLAHSMPSARAHGLWNKV